MKTHMIAYWMAHWTEMDWYKCNRCPFSTSMEYDLAEHMETHTFSHRITSFVMSPIIRLVEFAGL